MCAHYVGILLKRVALFVELTRNVSVRLCKGHMPLSCWHVATFTAAVHAHNTGALPVSSVSNQAVS